MKKYLIGLILLNLAMLGFTLVKIKQERGHLFTINDQQRRLRELKDQFTRITADYMLSSSIGLSGDTTTRPEIFLRLRINGCELCNVQVLKKIASLPVQQQSRFTIYSDNLTAEKLKQNYSFNPPGVTIEMKTNVPFDGRFREPKSYLFAYGPDGRLVSFFIPEYDLPELTDGYFEEILK